MKTDDIQDVCVVGGGTMGNGIAQLFATHGYQVTLVDQTPALLDRAQKTILNSLTRLKEKDKLSNEVGEILANLSVSTDLAEASQKAQLAIEVVPEKLPIKEQVLKSLDSNLPSDAILASNTSSISITELAAFTKRPERFIGMHFMNPVPIMKLVEVISGFSTNQATLQGIVQLAKDLDKVPIAVNDYPGFVSNRILMPMINEAIYTLFEGVAGVLEIDTVMQLGMAHPMGPLYLADFIGLDTCKSILDVLYQGFGNPKYAPCPLLINMVKAGKLGRKSGEGFYLHTPGSKEKIVNPTFTKFGI